MVQAYLYRRLHGSHGLIDGGEGRDGRHEDVVTDQDIPLDQGVGQGGRRHSDVGGHLVYTGRASQTTLRASTHIMLVITFLDQSFHMIGRHLSVGRCLWPSADGGHGGVGIAGCQGDCGEGGGVGLALLPLVCHEGRQGVELFLTLSTEEDVFVVCEEHQWGTCGFGPSIKVTLCVASHRLERAAWSLVLIQPLPVLVFWIPCPACFRCDPFLTHLIQMNVFLSGFCRA